MRIGDTQLGRRLSRLCLELEAQGDGRSVSNAGGFQSRDLTWQPDPSFRSLEELLHQPLATFLRRDGEGSPPAALRDVAGLCVRSVPVDLWANVNRPGNRNVIHNHGEPTSSVVASGVYYPTVEAAADGAASKAAALRLFVPSGTLDLTPEPGALLLFPTNLLHETQAVPPGAGPRISLAFNLRVRWLASPLARAAALGDVAQIQQLAAEGEAVDAPDPVLGLRPLHLAAECGHLAAVRALEALGADASAISLEGSSPLGLAFDRGHQDVERHLGGERGAVRAALRRAGLPPVRPASPSYPGVPTSRPDVAAAFEAAGLPQPGAAEQGSALGPAVLAGAALALVALLGAALAVLGGA